MAGYLPAAAAERAAQYAALGLSGPEALYRDVPESVRLTAPLNLPPPQSELEVRRTLEALAEEIGRNADQTRAYFRSLN